MPGLPFVHVTTAYPEAQVLPGLPASNASVRRLLSLALDLLYPPLCAGCGRIDVRWCARCQQALDSIPLQAETVPHLPLSDAAATGSHEGLLQSAVWALKFDNNRDMAIPLGDRLAQQLGRLTWQPDMIVPVPLHPARMAERGYNQSQLLAERMAAQVSLPCIPGALARLRQTQSQVGLNQQQRQSNMEGAFSAESEFVTGHTVLLIDDVYTTGATLAACAEAALNAGAHVVYGLTVTAARG